MPTERWMRLMRATWTTNPAIERYAVTSARKAAMPSPPPSPCVASAAMLNCWSRTAAPAAAHPTVRASTRSELDPAIRRRASRPPTPRSEASKSACSPTRWPRSTSTTMPAQAARVAALTSTSCSEPTSSTMAAVNPDPRAPPRLAPPPMNPNRRFACRASKMSFARVQNWLISRMPRIRPKK